MSTNQTNGQHHLPRGAEADLPALRDLLDEFAALKARLADQEARLARQEAELTALRAVAAEAPAEPPTPLAERMLVLPERGTSRRALLARSAAALAALGLAGAAGVPTAGAQPQPPGGKGQPQAVGNGGPLQLGLVNAASTEFDTTVLTNPSINAGRVLFQVSNSPTTPLTFSTNQRISLAATNNYSGTTAPPIGSGEQHIALYGRAPAAIGVAADGLWPLWIVPSNTTGQPPTTDSAGNTVPAGVLVYQAPGPTTPGTLWISTGVGAGPLSGYRRIQSTDSAGELVLITPTRVVETRPTAPPIVTVGYDAATGQAITAGPIQAGQTRRFLISGKTFPQGTGSFTFPADIRGILANVTIITSNVGGGFVTVFPGNVPDAQKPNASTVNPSTPIAANFTAVAISPSTNFPPPSYGSIAVFSSFTTDVAIDVVGYFY